MRRYAVACALLLLGCDSGHGPVAARQGESAASAASASESATGAVASIKPEAITSIDPGTAAGGPGPLHRYDVGHRASAHDIALWNRDVGPDGAELPSGSGTVAQGEQLYRTKCLMCHNVDGKGTPPAFPALIGRDAAAEGFHFASDPRLVKTIGNYWPYATTVFDYVRRAMPQTQPGSLNDREVYALTAYLLASNKIIPAGTTLDARRLRDVRMPYADRFVRDDRRGGAQVK